MITPQQLKRIKLYDNPRHGPIVKLVDLPAYLEYYQVVPSVGIATPPVIIPHNNDSPPPLVLRVSRV